MINENHLKEDFNRLNINSRTLCEEAFFKDPSIANEILTAYIFFVGYGIYIADKFGTYLNISERKQLSELRSFFESSANFLFKFGFHDEANAFIAMSDGNKNVVEQHFTNPHISLAITSYNPFLSSMENSELSSEVKREIYEAFIDVFYSFLVSSGAILSMDIILNEHKALADDEDYINVKNGFELIKNKSETLNINLSKLKDVSQRIIFQTLLEKTNFHESFDTFVFAEDYGVHGSEEDEYDFFDSNNIYESEW